MSKLQRCTYSLEFQLETTQLVVDKGYTLRKAAAAMNVGHSSLGREVEKERAGGPPGKAMTPEQQEIQAQIQACHGLSRGSAGARTLAEMVSLQGRI